MKLKDIDLIGIPIKIIIGPKGLKDGKVEIKSRKTGETKLVEINKAVSQVLGEPSDSAQGSKEG